MSFRNLQGLTLIEVLIALAIISIAFTAIIKASSQSICSNTYLEDKTMAMWIGEEIVNQMRLKIIVPEATGDELNDHTEIFNREWYWQGKLSDTPNPRIKKITVKVFPKEPDHHEEPIADLESYLYAS